MKKLAEAEFDEAIVGVVLRYGDEPYIVYDRDQVLEILQQRDMNDEEAQEYFEVNMLGSWEGDTTPGFVVRADAQQIDENWVEEDDDD